MNITDRQAYDLYCEWCERIGAAPATPEVWAQTHSRIRPSIDANRNPDGRVLYSW